MYGGYQKIGLFGCFEQKNLKKPQKDESYQEGFRTDPYCNMGRGDEKGVFGFLDFFAFVVHQKYKKNVEQKREKKKAKKKKEKKKKEELKVQTRVESANTSPFIGRRRHLKKMLEFLLKQ